MKTKILIVAAHPDDEVLGCFGTVARLIKQGYEAHTLILGEGKTSRDNKRDTDLKKDELQILNKEIITANKLIGIDKIFTQNFPDNRFDSIDLIDIIKAIESVKNEIKPDIIFTHYKDDLNIDHQITYNAVITATRPIKGESVKEIYSFEILSSTEWAYPQSFSPDTFFDISDTLELKIKAMGEYASELREFPHPRSLKGIEINAVNRGMQVGLTYAEAFRCVRRIR
ncbi:PIG-L deacetylase family protein [Campylobacter mucosalis]|uniref:PIG-L deacetylase family protein n=1 Tax=Campylobacter mucosalis TaxID=202 RepID=UPI00146FD0D2|nr:PIG-L deacetylase family protein [Campylobacter mucosalis]